MAEDHPPSVSPHAWAIPPHIWDLQQQISKINERLALLEGAPAPPPGEWRNDRPPTSEDVGPSGMIWVWNSGKLGSADHQFAAFWYSSNPANNYWAPGNQPVPTSPPPQPEPVSEHKPRVTPMWINDRLPNEYDSPSGDPRVYQWDATRGVYAVAYWDVKPGEWWASGRLEKPTSPPPQPEPDDDPQPSQWRNDRPPEGREEADDGMVWCWYGGGIRPIHGEMVRSLCAAGSRPYWAPGNQPAPALLPPGLPPDLQPEPAPTGWITDRVPEEVDGDRQENVQVPPRDSGRGVCIVHYLAVRRGTPWAPINDDPGPWDPTTLDRNGWIRSRLPTEGDASKDRGKWVLVPQGKERRTIQEYAVIVPGQPWAPWGSDPGHYQP
jgi:hypothetical protein